MESGISSSRSALPVFLATDPLFVKLWQPPIVTVETMTAAFGRVRAPSPRRRFRIRTCDGCSNFAESPHDPTA